MKTANLLLIFGILISISISQTVNCPLAANQQSRIISDTVGLNAQNNNNNDTSQRLIYSYTFDDAFGSTPDVAIGLNEITSAESPYLELLVSNARTTQKGIYFQAQSGSQSKWENFRINFIATDRQDIELGSATVFNSANQQSGLQLRYPINKDFSNERIRVKSFLQGVSVQSIDHSTISVRQNSTIISSHTLYFTFASVARTSIIHQLSISVIIYSIDTPGVLYADGILDQNYVVSKTEITIPRHGINQLRTYIVGINSFETSATQPISISSAIDQTFRLVIGPIDRNQIDYISVSYLILSIIDCGSCSGFPLLFDGICNVNCPEGTKQDNGVCIPVQCKDGYEKADDGQCIPICQQHAYYDRQIKRCVCLPKFYLINNRCQPCANDEYFSYIERICKPYCVGNSYYSISDAKCYCNQGYYLIDESCQQCRYGSYYSPVDKKCLDICGVNEIFSPQGCICRNGYYKIDGKCERCPYGLIWKPESNSCGCKRGYDLLEGNICRKQCEKNERRVGYYCQCQTGFERINGKCDVCPENSYYDFMTQSCKCEYRYTLVQGKCMIKCPQFQYLNETSKLCIDRCNRYGQVWNSQRQQCECHRDFELNSDGKCIVKCGAIQFRNANGQCQCFKGYWKNPYGQCRVINCPVGTFWNETMQDCISVCHPLEVFVNGDCFCQDGYKKDNIYGKCIPDCNGNQVRVNGFCQCAPGYRTIPGGLCILDCAPGSTNVNGMCVCKQNCGKSVTPYCPYGQTFDPIIRQCRCKSPKTWVLGQCIEHHQCGVNEYWCGSYCACKNGFFRIDGVCRYVPPARTCPPNSVSNGVNCLCLDGFYPVVPGFCRKCPPNQFWTGSRCALDYCDPEFIYDPITATCNPRKPLCNANQYWTGVNCRCKQGYFWIDHECKSCPYGTFFDGFTCSTGSHHKCDDPYALYNGKTCVCIPGYYPLSDGKCVTCPPRTKWDGTCCKPQAGYYLPDTTV